MICFEDKLDSAINGLCPTILGMENNGYLLLRSDVANRSITDFVASFIPTSPAIPVYHPLNDLAYKPKSEGTTNAYGLTKFEKSIELFILANTELSQTQLMQLKNNNAEWVFVGIQKDGQIVVFGFERGLKLKTSMQELNSLDTHGGIVLTFDETAVNTPMLFSNALSISYFDMDMIYGGTIANGGAVKFEIDNDKTGYIKLPNGTLLTTVAGVIDTTYSGVGGAITYYVPKNSTVAEIENSGLTGAITTNFAGIILVEGSNGITGLTAPYSIQIGCRNMPLLTNLVAPHVLGLAVSGSALTAKSIGDILYAAYIDNRANVVYDFSGGTNAEYDDIKTYIFNTYGVAGTTVVTALENLGGVITFN